MTSHLDALLKNWKRIHKQTTKIMASAPNDKYDWKPCDSAMPLGELMNHLWIAEWGLIEAAMTGAFPKERPEPINDTAALIAAFDKTHEEVVAKVAAMTPDQLAEEITPFGPEKKMTRLALVEITQEHEIHHRGQLFTYLRVAGCEVPSLF